MKPKLIAILIVLTVAPLAVMAGLGVRLARGERAVTEQRLRNLLTSKLAAIDDEIATLTRGYEDRLGLAATAGRGDPKVVAEVLNRGPEVAAFFAIDAQGDLTVPPPSDYSGPVDQAFLREVHHRWRTAQDGPPGSKGASTRQRGWHTWYWNEGLQFIYWWRLPDGGIAGVHLRRARFLADVVAALPDTAPGDATWADARVVLRDAQSRPLYQWGPYEPPEGGAPAATLTLSPPLSAWSLDYHAAPSVLALPRQGLLFNLVAGLAAMGLVLTVLAVYFYRETTRATREATQRVTFVNQVSHELKTPLTNIRMYAELLEDEIDSDGPAVRHLDVIVSESQRLSRLIGNVLTFGRHRRNELRLHPKAGVVDETVRRAAERERGTLAHKGIALKLELDAAATVMVDSDALEQILGNLLSNVEKYATNAGKVSIATALTNGVTIIQVSDDGPGIPAAARKQVFEPFFRCHDKLSDGVAGTGIGLAIARELARLHGGDLVVVDTEQGASFHLTLATPRQEDEAG